MSKKDYNRLIKLNNNIYIYKVLYNSTFKKHNGYNISYKPVNILSSEIITYKNVIKLLKKDKRVTINLS